MKDADNNPAPGATVTFAVTAGSGSVTGPIQTTDVNGVARVGGWTLGTVVGANQLTATVSTGLAAAGHELAERRSSPGVRGTEQPPGSPRPAAGSPAPAAVFTVTFSAETVPGAASALALTGIPATPMAGATSDLTVAAQDTYGNTATGYRGTVHFTSDDPAATLPADYAFLPADNGVHTFAGGVTLKTAGSRTVTATDAATNTITGTQFATVKPAEAASLAVTGVPAALGAGTVSDVTVRALDAFNNTATGYTGTILFTSSDPIALLPPDYTFTTGDAGAHTFTGGVTFKTFGTQTVTATDGTISSITGVQSVTVLASSAAVLALTGLPASLTAGTTSTLTVTAKDSYGNTAAYTGTVHFTSTDPAAVLPVDYTFTVGDAGAHTFTEVAFKTVGSRAVTATDVVTSSITGSQSTTVNPATAAALLVAGLPASLVAGTASDVTVTASDAYGNVARGYTGAVHFTSTDPAAVLPADYTFVSGDNGVHTFSGAVVLKTAGSRTVTATDLAASSITGSQSATVGPAAAATFAVSGIPDPATAGVAATATVTARDVYGNTATGYLGTANLTSTDPAAVLPASLSFTAPDAGTKNITVTLKTAGSRTLTATDAVSTSITGSQSVTVAPAAAAALVFTVQPTDATAGTSISPAVQLTARDAFGNVATGFTASVTITIGTNPSGGILGGTAAVAASAGVATFSGLSIDKYGSNYTLTGAAAGVAGVTSSAFTVTPIGMTARWTGAASTDWSTSANWSPASVPTTSSNVFVPKPPANQPALTSGPITVNDLIIEQGATLDIGALTLIATGNLAAGHTIVGTTGTVQLAGTGKTVSGKVPVLLISGSYTASDSVIVGGNLTIQGLAGSLTLGGHRVKVGGNFTTRDTATVTMTNTADTLDVGLETRFAGTSHAGLLTAGTILARGDFVQTGNMRQVGFCFVADAPESFKATGTHLVEFVGSGPQSLTFETPTGTLAPPVTTLLAEVICPPAYTGGSQFQNLKIANTGGLSFLSGAIVLGNLTETSGDINLGTQYVSVGGNVTTGAGALSGSSGSLVEVGGTLSVGGTFSVGITTFFGTNQVIPPTLAYQSIRVLGSGNSTLGDGSLLALGGGSGTLTVGGSVHLSLAGRTQAAAASVAGSGQLILNNHTLSLSGNFGVTALGTLVMTQPLDTLIIGGDGAFSGGDETGLLTAGVIRLTGSFNSQFASDPRSFAASGTHKVILSGTLSPNVVSLGDPTQSHFQDLEVQNTNGLGLSSSITVLGNYTSNPGGPITATSGTLGLHVSGNLTAPSIVLDTIQVGGVLSVSGTYTVVNTIFSGTGQTIPPTLGYQSLTVNGSASLGAPLSITGDLAVLIGGSLGIGSNTITVAGNVAGGNTITGTGLVRMSGPGKALSGTLPNLIVQDSVVLSGNTTITGDSLVVTAGLLHLNGKVLSIANGAFRTRTTGALRMDTPTDSLLAFKTTFEGASTSGRLTDGRLAVRDSFLVSPLGASGAYSPSLNHLTIFAAPATSVQHVGVTAVPGSGFRHVLVTGNQVLMDSSATIFGNLTISQGQMTILKSLTVGGNFATTGSGNVQMTSPLAALDVAGNVAFGGLGTAGLLTQGTLTVGGDFTQTGDAQSFAPSGTHVTVLDGAAAQTVSFANPGASASKFQELDIENTTTTGAGVTFTSSAQIDGSVTLGAVGSITNSTTGTVTIGGGLDNSLSDGTAAWNVLNTTFTGSPLALPSQITGNVTVSGAGANLALGDFASLTVNGNFETQSGGMLTMFAVSFPPTFTINGNATFAGGSTDTKLTSGVLQVGGNFTQSGAASSFAASGSHTTRFTGGATKTIAFANAGTGAAFSHFQNLELADAGGTITLSSATGNTYANGSLTANPATTPVTIIGAGQGLQVSDLNVAGLKLDRVLFRYFAASTAVSTFNNVTFQNYLDNDLVFWVKHTGNATPFAFTGMSFNNLTAGLYLRAEDPTADANSLTISITHTTGFPGNGPALTATVGSPLPLVTWIP